MRTWGVVVALGVVVSGCGDDGPGMLPDAPLADASPDAPACPESASTGPGTMHGANVMADETWTVAGSPHVVTISMNVRAAKLTIEPCAVVRIRPGLIITVGQTIGAPVASIVAHGDAMHPITFQRDQSMMAWGPLRVFPTGSVDFEHVVLKGGIDTITASGAGGNMGLTRNVRVVDTSIEGAAGFGVKLETRGAFSADSANLRISGATTTPMIVDGPAVSTVPTGTYTGNTLDAIRVASSSSLLDPDIVFRARGVPYRIDTFFSMSPMTSAAVGGLSTLTIEAGVRIEFNAGLARSMQLGSSNGGLPANIFPVRLIAQGTQAQPIVLTSSAATAVPAPGDWAGIEWRGGPPTGNVMSHVRVEYAGADSGTQGFGCGQADNDAALIITNWRPDTAFITDSTFSNSAAGGIVSGWVTDLGGPSLVGNNTFTAIANGCNVSRWRDLNGSCPGTPPLCM